ncbi:type II toxin-antitoxin system RelE/ParE family toxin [Iningainema sp. BLCCT55]|uniref:Type II toxin-antitoxin system RelE/ParE family toxin n=1 Tax=Iningainema tapete BLCC-T55 TaxID=2748662 RepID=A0A8J7C945_9CYAN|nr:type II toxin-antitoxin system RelE/ParE family toxin [Iningainema tapete BLCC-T55]
MYSIALSEEATQFFEAASAKLQERLDRAFEQIKTNPRFHLNIKTLKGNYAGYYRYRVGDYRIVYSIDDQTMRVLVNIIAHRSEVYDS